MNILDALKPTTKATLKLDDGEEVNYAQWRNESIWWIDEKTGKWDREVGHLDMLQGNWQPYHEAEEIVPENAFELWKRGAYKYFTIRISGTSLQFVNDSGQSVVGIERAIHNKNGWTREYPKVEDEVLLEEDRQLIEELTGEPEFPFWVKIIRCSSEHYWYKDKINGIFKVIDFEKMPESDGVWKFSKRYKMDDGVSTIVVDDCERVEAKCLEKY